MSGNVWEWVQDCWHENYNKAPTDGRALTEENGGNCGLRVFRGGSWNNNPESLRLSTSSRYRNNTGYRYFNLGFRLAQDVE